MGWHPHHPNQIVLNASGSIDPDDLANVEPFIYDFSCARDDDRPCFGTNGRGSIAAGVWTIPPGMLTTDKSHTFTVTVRKGESHCFHLEGPQLVCWCLGRSACLQLVLQLHAPPQCKHKWQFLSSRFAAIAASSDRMAYASLEGVRPRSAAVPTGTIIRACGALACPQQHSSDQPLSLSLQLPPAFAAAAVQWSSDQVALAGTGLNLNGLDLTIPAALLPRGGVVTVSAALTLSGQTGTATLAVPVNAAPYCADAAGVCLAVDTKSDVFPGSAFVATAVNIADDGGVSALKWVFGVELHLMLVWALVWVCWCMWVWVWVCGLAVSGRRVANCAGAESQMSQTQHLGAMQSCPGHSMPSPMPAALPPSRPATLPLRSHVLAPPCPYSYEFGLVINGAPSPLITDGATNYKFASLPLGSSTLYVRAIDAQGASVTVTRSVTVQNPPAGFDVGSAVAAVDVSRAISTGDPAAINQAAMAIASLASYGMSASGMSANATAAFAQGVDAKASAVLSASTAKLDVTDPEATRAAASTAATVVKVTTNMDRCV